MVQAVLDDLFSQLPAGLLADLLPVDPAGPLALVTALATTALVFARRSPSPQHGALAAMIGELAAALRKPGAELLASAYREGYARGDGDGYARGDADGYARAVAEMSAPPPQLRRVV